MSRTSELSPGSRGYWGISVEEILAGWAAIRDLRATIAYMDGWSWNVDQLIALAEIGVSEFGPDTAHRTIQKLSRERFDVFNSLLQARLIVGEPYLYEMYSVSAEGEVACKTAMDLLEQEVGRAVRTAGGAVWPKSSMLDSKD